jgi:hypothetical protein
MTEEATSLEDKTGETVEHAAILEAIDKLDCDDLVISLYLEEKDKDVPTISLAAGIEDADKLIEIIQYLKGRKNARQD